MISATGCSLSAGRAVSLLGFACGVSPVPLLPQEAPATRINFFSIFIESNYKQQSFREQPLLKRALDHCSCYENFGFLLNSFLSPLSTVNKISDRWRASRAVPLTIKDTLVDRAPGSS
ncbi:MAG: hypothetical protein ACQEWI_17850 [Bacillota bacterium]